MTGKDSLTLAGCWSAGEEVGIADVTASDEDRGDANVPMEQDNKSDGG